MTFPISADTTVAWTATSYGCVGGAAAIHATFAFSYEEVTIHHGGWFKL